MTFCFSCLVEVNQSFITIDHFGPSKSYAKSRVVFLDWKGWHCKSAIFCTHWIFVCWGPPVFLTHETSVQTLTAADSLTCFGLYVCILFLHRNCRVQNTREWNACRLIWIYSVSGRAITMKSTSSQMSFKCAPDRAYCNWIVKAFQVWTYKAKRAKGCVLGFCRQKEMFLGWRSRYRARSFTIHFRANCCVRCEAFSVTTEAQLAVLREQFSIAREINALANLEQLLFVVYYHWFSAAIYQLYFASNSVAIIVVRTPLDQTLCRFIFFIALVSASIWNWKYIRVPCGS